MTSSDGSNKKAAPFEWLSGGLFFGGGKNRGVGGSGSGIESIESCKDVMSLLNGVQDNLNKVVAANRKAESRSSGALGGVAADCPSDSFRPEDEASTSAAAAATAAARAAATTENKFLAARLARLRFLLYEERRISSQQQDSRRGGVPVVAGAALQGLTGERCRDLVPRLLENLCVLPFESRKHVAAMFNYLLVCGLDGGDAGLYRPIMYTFRDYVSANFDQIMSTIVDGHNCLSSKHQSAAASSTSDVALHFGSMYRSCARHPFLYGQLVGTSESAARYVFPFLDVYVHLPNFDISSDAMESVRVVFTAGSSPQGGTAGDDRSASSSSYVSPEDYEETQLLMSQAAAEFLTRDYEEVWDKRYNAKLLSGSANYMTRRVALQILSTVLLTRANYNVMIRYVASRTNLILAMHLLRDTSPHITLDAFHVFKVFVANPNKPQDIIKILRDNKVKLCRYLTTLHQDREESDQQFREEKALIIATIDAL